ncbi:MAG: ATP synthase F1 subunit gamma [Paludibacter sp.]|nr:ATP synthase F1 subunit gamma [Paludibacter sp.]
MGSLKEIKSRVQSVKSTQKITSAMKMVSSAKLRKAEKVIESFYPYEQKMTELLSKFLSSQEAVDANELTKIREVKKIAIIVFSSNSSLCGSFNSNVLKRFLAELKSYGKLGRENILVYSVGKMVSKACVKMGFKVEDRYDEYVDKPDYKGISIFSDDMMRKFLHKDIDKVVLVYHHFKSKSSQELLCETLLPFPVDAEAKKQNTDYLIEPDVETIIDDLIPKVIKLKIYTALLDSVASEHAARTIAMQTATENADELLQELSLQYNKSRQQAITNELQDIVGGSFQ